MTTEIERGEIEVEQRDNGVVITLASGDAGNLLGVAELDVITAVLRGAEEAGKRWALIRQHGRDFCLGRPPEPRGDRTRRTLIGFVQMLQSLELVTVAEADGGCAGFGVGLFALADISIAADSAWFQFPEILNGVAPAIVASWLYDRVPYKKALHWTMTGERFGPADAERFGLASRVVPAPDLKAAAQATVEALDATPAKALRDCKSAARVMAAAPQDPVMRQAVALKWFS
jgi:enoyl-CoA hydratase/carnithine racemase